MNPFIPFLMAAQIFIAPAPQQQVKNDKQKSLVIKQQKHQKFPHHQAHKKSYR